MHMVEPTMQVDEYKMKIEEEKGEIAETAKGRSPFKGQSPAKMCQ